MPGFEAVEVKMCEAGLAEPVRATFRHYWEQLAAGSTGLVAEADIEPATDLPVLDSLRREDTRDPSHDVLDALAVIKLNGGLGTSMGMTQAKSLLVAKAGLSFLEITARQVLALRHAWGARLPLLLMNSFRTRADCLAVLESFPELTSDVPADFLQNKVPKLRADDLAPVAWPADPALEWCPPGHGDLYTALVASGTLEHLLSRGYRWAFVSNSDNLGAVPDPALLGWIATREVPFVMEVARRTEADRKGGHLARRRADGRLILREVAQCADSELDAFQDVDRHRYFNTNSIWVDLHVLERVLETHGGVLGLPMIRNVKTVDPADTSSPAVIQLETAMGAALGVFEGAEAVEVGRDRFVPVKTSGDLLKLWSDIYDLTPDWRVVARPDREVDDLVVDLDPEYFRRIDQLTSRFPSGAPSLVACTEFRVRGDVEFGRDVTARGHVTVTTSGRARVADGTLLAGDVTL